LDRGDQGGSNGGDFIVNASVLREIVGFKDNTENHENKSWRKEVGQKGVWQ
jgi:hypothetical protein